MRHQKKGRRLGRNATHRQAMFANMVASLIEHERIQTTQAKAKEARRLVERAITWATSLGELLTKDPENRSAEEKAKYVHHVRMAKRVVKNKKALQKLFEEVAPRFVDRPGGYTRIIKVRNRTGDNAPLCFLELVDFQIGGADE